MIKTIRDRNAEIVRMRRQGVPTTEVARVFGLSPSRIRRIESEAVAAEALAERQAVLRAQMRAVDDPEKMWPVSDLIDAIGTTRLAKIQLLKHLAQFELSQMSLRELMEMCLPPSRVSDLIGLPPLLKICGIGKKCFWSVADGLTNTDLGSRCNEEWQLRLAKVKQFWGRPT